MFPHRIFSYLLLGSLLLGSCGQKNETTQPIVENITESVYASGTVKSRNQYNLYSTVNGIIKEIYVREGDTVQKGSPIMKIQNETARLNAENARIAADYAAISNNADKLRELGANISLAKARLDNDSVLYERQQKLWNSGIGTRNELEQRQLAVTNSKSAYEVALLKYSELQRQIDFTDRQSRKSLEISKVQQNDFIIRSESSGRVYDLLKEKGETVNLQSPVAVIGDAQDFYLELSVDEYDIARVQPMQKVLLSFDSYKGAVYEAVIEKIEPIMDERSRSFIVKAALTKSPPKLFPFLSVDANIIIRTKENVLTIPRAYLLGDTAVLIGKKELRKVVTGIKDYRKAEIISGLKAGETIVHP
jgi:HlyD family secretion protein